MNVRIIGGALALAASVVLGGCNGSAATAGIEGTGVTVASGPITGFGSIFVNGIEFNTSSASILLNGQSGSQSQLRAGQVVSVTGTISAGGTAGTATEVQFDANVQGPVGAKDLIGSSLTVLGQIVLVGPSTSFGADAGPTPTLASIPPGTLAQVSGYPNAGGAIVATRVELKSALDEFIVVGSVGALDAAHHRFAVNAASIDYSSASLGGFPGGRSPQNGDRVEVMSAATAASGTLMAARVQLISAVGPSGDDGQIQGVITRYASSTDFDVNRATVTTSAITTYDNGSAANLALNASLEVEGAFNAAGALAATHIRFNQTAPLLLRSTVQAINAPAGTLTVFGVTVATDSGTRFDDQSAAPVVPFNLAALRIGDTVEVRGSVTAGKPLAATLLTREVPGAVEVRGTATAVAAPVLTVLGIAATTGATTQFLQDAQTPISAAQFFARAPGAIVDLKGSLAAGVFNVDTAQLSGGAELDD